MNKLIIAIIVVLVLVVGGAYLVGLNETEAPTDTDTQDQTQQEDMNTDTEDEMENGTTTEEAPDPVTIDITGENFEFSQDEIRVQEGAEVTINFTSTDGFHDWVVDEFDAATERVNTDGSASVTFIADTAGSFPFYCSVGNHRQLGMEGMLIVE